MKVRMTPFPMTSYEGSKFEEHNTLSVDSSGLWRDDASELKPCWTKPSLGINFEIDLIFEP